MWKVCEHTFHMTSNLLYAAKPHERPASEDEVAENQVSFQVYNKDRMEARKDCQGSLICLEGELNR
jgi:hypothetical protein